MFVCEGEWGGGERERERERERKRESERERERTLFFFFKELYFTTYIAGTTQYNAFL